MKFQIELASNDQIKEIVDLLNIVTLDLHKKNINQWNYPWNQEELLLNITNKGLYIVFFDAKIIGTFSIKTKLSKSWIPEIEEDILYLHTLAILPEFHGRNIGVAIINYAHALAKSLDKPLYLDCWSQNEKLKEYYSNCGFKHCMDSPEEDFTISVFRFNRE